MLPSTEYHPSADRFTRMLAAKGVRFVDDREPAPPPDYHAILRKRRREARERQARHDAALQLIRDAMRRAVDEAKEAGRMFSLTGIEPPPKPLRAAFAEIKAQVADKHRVSVLDLESANKTRRVTAARFEAMWRCRRETTASCPQIGRAFGGRDHTTVLNAIARHQAKIEAGEA